MTVFLFCISTGSHAVGSHTRSYYPLDIACGGRTDAGTDAQQQPNADFVCGFFGGRATVWARFRHSFGAFQAVGLVSMDLDSLSGQPEASIALISCAHHRNSRADSIPAGVGGGCQFFGAGAAKSNLAAWLDVGRHWWRNGAIAPKTRLGLVNLLWWSGVGGTESLHCRLFSIQQQTVQNTGLASVFAQDLEIQKRATTHVLLSKTALLRLRFFIEVLYRGSL